MSKLEKKESKNQQQLTTKKTSHPKKEKINRYYARLLTKCKREWSFYSPIKKECANLAREQIGTVYKWWCNHCNDKFAWSEIEFDHIEPIGNTVPSNLEEFLECVRKLNSPLENLQVLCKKCHKIKTYLDEHGEDIKLLSKTCENWLTEKGFVLNLSSLDYRKLKKLHNIINKIDSIESPKKKQTWRKKLLEFIKTHG